MHPYHHWLTAPVRLEEVVVTVATKPGVFAHGAHDPAADMLAQWIAAAGPQAIATDCDRPRSVHLQAGNGLVAAVAGAQGYLAMACDRSAPNAAAAARTLALSSGQQPLGDAAEAVQHVGIPGKHVADGEAALVTIRIPTDRLGIQLAVAEAFRMLRGGGVCLLAGGNDEGAKPAAKLLQAVFGNASVEAQHSGHRMVRAAKVSATPGDEAIFSLPWLDLSHFHAVPVAFAGADDTVLEFSQFTRPGVFSWEHLDEATSLLADIMNIRPGDRVLDLGCGAGALGVVATVRSGVPAVLVDADADAVRGAQRTVEGAGLSGVQVLASDVGSAVKGQSFDVVVTNPPFHVGKATDLTVPQAFIDDAWEVLAPGGRLYLVANRTLPYERLIHARFGEVRVAHDGRRFKVLGAVRS